MQDRKPAINRCWLAQPGSEKAMTAFFRIQESIVDRCAILIFSTWVTKHLARHLVKDFGLLFVWLVLE